MLAATLSGVTSILEAHERRGNCRCGICSTTSSPTTLQQSPQAKRTQQAARTPQPSVMSSTSTTMRPRNLGRPRGIAFFFSLRPMPRESEGQRLLHSTAPSELAVRLRQSGVRLGDVYQHISSLYFRGKLEYAQKVSQSPSAGCGRADHHREWSDAAGNSHPLRRVSAAPRLISIGASNARVTAQSLIASI